MKFVRIFVTFDHLKPAVVNSCIGMCESCIQKEQRERRERQREGDVDSEGGEKRDTKWGKERV